MEIWFQDNGRNGKNMTGILKPGTVVPCLVFGSKTIVEIV